MIEVREGQFVVVMAYGSFRTIRADRVTDKTVRMYTRGRTRWDQYGREQVQFAHDTREGAQAVEDSLEAARAAYRHEVLCSKSLFDKEIAPALAAQEAREAAHERTYAELRAAIIEKASA